MTSGHALLSRPRLLPLAAGPARDSSDGVVVSATDFAVHRWRDVPRAVAAGLRLRLGWYAMEGAVGLWLWSLPLERRSGSISVWLEEEHLRRFVALPAHLAIMRRNRARGTLRSTTWHAPRFDPGEVLATGLPWISGNGIPQ